MIPQPFIDEVLERTDLAGLVGEYVQLSRRGASSAGLCPFHEEKSPSFRVMSDHYHCYGCGAHGNAISFLIERNGLPFTEAVRVLAQRNGMQMESMNVPRPASVPLSGAEAALRRACAVYQELLFGNAKGPAQVELDKRGVDIDTAVRYGLGFAPDRWDTLSGRTDFAQKDLLESSLAIERSESRGCYDRFRNRLMFPIGDAKGRIVGFGGRQLKEGDGAKYMNSPESELYQKGRLLYGQHQAIAGIRKENHVVVTEGYFDVISSSQHGIDYVVGTCGTALTTEHCEILLSLADKITLCFDADTAGNRASWAAARLLAARLNDGHEIRFCKLPGGHDPDSLLRAEGAEAFQSCLDAALPLSAYVIQEVTKGARSVEHRVRALQAGAELWLSVTAPMTRQLFKQALCEALELKEAEFDRLVISPSNASGEPGLRPCGSCNQPAAFKAEGPRARAYCTNPNCGITTPMMESLDAARTTWNRRYRFRYAA